MGISDRIESFILELLKDDDNWLEIGRNELASVFNCVPSQINYVIQTRFSPDKGYMVESRRGGGGYLRIKRVVVDSESLLYDTIVRIGKSIDAPMARSIVEYLALNGVIDDTTCKLMLSAVSEKSIPPGSEQRDVIRANVLKNMMLILM